MRGPVAGDGGRALLQIALLIARGLSKRGIADELAISPATALPAKCREAPAPSVITDFLEGWDGGHFLDDDDRARPCAGDR